MSTSERLLAALSAAPADAASDLPDYVRDFCERLRRLEGVPFRYLVPDPALLPEESVRFFFVDRSWVDAAVAGALQAGAIGTRDAEQAGLAATALTAAATPDPPVTGMLIRSLAVSGWPAMAVQAFDVALPPNPRQPDIDAHRLQTIRVERLAPTVLLVLWRGIPASVWLEEPHHALQLGGRIDNQTQLVIERRRADGTLVDPGNPANDLTVPMRASRVVDVRALRRTLHTDATLRPQMPTQSGSAAFALQLLSPPWRQRFQGDRA